jgi:hypothetical protein
MKTYNSDVLGKVTIPDNNEMTQQQYDAGYYKNRKLEILSISPIPRNIRGKCSDGNWAVDCEVKASLGNGRVGYSEYFWRKKDAETWIINHSWAINKEATHA